MARSELHHRQCPHRQQETAHPDQELHRQMNLLLSRLDEQQSRWYMAVEANRLGVGGQRLLLKSRVWTKRRSGEGSRNERLIWLTAPASTCVWPAQDANLLKKGVELELALQQLAEPETADNRMSEQKWVHSSLRHLSQRLKDLGHRISPPTVDRLLGKLGCALRVNVKKHEGSSAHTQRNQQFEQIEAHKQRFQVAGLPIISVDTKKKELIGNFKNAGQTWCQRPEEVNAHDFPSEALVRAVPYGIDDVSCKYGSVYVGVWADTTEFAVAAIARWWQDEARLNFQEAN